VAKAILRMEIGRDGAVLAVPVVVEEAEMVVAVVEEARVAIVAASAGVTDHQAVVYLKSNL
jgi:hypothetical protein